jgi:putative transposase
MVDARGVPLSLVVSGANMYDVKLLEMTLDAVVIDRPEPRKFQPQHMCADAGYKGKGAKEAVTAKNYRPHIKQRREESDAKRCKPGYQARRWVTAKTHVIEHREHGTETGFDVAQAFAIG